MIYIYLSASIRCVVIYNELPVSLSWYWGSFITSMSVTLESFLPIVFKYVSLILTPYLVTSLLGLSENICYMYNVKGHDS